MPVFPIYLAVSAEDAHLQNITSPSLSLNSTFPTMVSYKLQNPSRVLLQLLNTYFLPLIFNPADKFSLVSFLLSATSLWENMWMVELTESISGVEIRPGQFS